MGQDDLAAVSAVFCLRWFQFIDIPEMGGLNVHPKM